MNFGPKFCRFSHQYLSHHLKARPISFLNGFIDVSDICLTFSYAGDHNQSGFHNCSQTCLLTDAFVTFFISKLRFYSER